MVEAGVEAEFLDHEVAFRRPAGDADDAAAARSCAICPTTWPTAPEAAETTTVSPALGWPISSSPTQAVSPGMPSTPRLADSGASFAGRPGTAARPRRTEKRCQPKPPSTAVARREAGIARGDDLADRLPPSITRADLDRLGVGFRIAIRPRM